MEVKTPTTPEAELLQLTQKLLDSILAADWESYIELVDPSLSSFEPEAAGTDLPEFF